MALIAASLFASACRGPTAPGGTSTTSRVADSITVAVTMGDGRLDPHVLTRWEVLYVLSSVYDTLLYQRADGSFTAGLARAWQVSPDGLTYTFDLRDDVHFQDGTPFNAEAVKYNFDRIRALGTRSLKAGPLTAAVDHAEVLGPYRVALHLKHPDSGLLFSLSLPFVAMVSPTAAQRWGDNYDMHQSGTGPFRMAEYVPGDHYTLERNPDYHWGPDIYDHAGPAYLKRVTFRFLPEPTTRAPALQAGDFDMVLDLLPGDAHRIEADPRLALSRARLSGQPAFWFINTAKPPTDDLRVRQAILYGVDMEAGVHAIMRGQNPAAHGPLSAVTPDYDADVAGLYPYDPDRAKALLDEAGWSDHDGDGIRDRNGKPLSIDVSMVNWGESAPFSVLLQSQLRALGIQVNLEMMDFSVEILAGQRGTKNMLFMGGSGYSASDSIAPFFDSANADDGFAWSKSHDPLLDDMIHRAGTALDAADRTRYYDEAQMRIMQQALMLPIYDYVQLIGVTRRIKGLRWLSVGLVPSLHDVYLGEAPMVDPADEPQPAVDQHPDTAPTEGN